MKKGCFLTAIILFTVILGVVFFVIRNYGDEVLDSAKKVVLDFSSDDILDSIGEIENNRYKDSLQVLVQTYVERIEEKDFNDAVNETNEFAERIKFIIHDGVVDSADIFLLRKYMREDER